MSYDVMEKFIRSEGSYPISDFCGQKSEEGKPKALISGAGIAGLAAAFELISKGFEVVVVDRRQEFSRSNIINLNAEVQVFLRKFELLKEFEESVAARIEKHKCVIFGKNRLQVLPESDVSGLSFEGMLPKSSEEFAALFTQEGIYSVQIKDVQAFLAEKAAKLGVHILSETEVQILDPVLCGRVSRVQMRKKHSSEPPLIYQPDLFFIAEGSHSTTVEHLGMSHEEVINDCSGENWVFGNLRYSGKANFVVSIVDTTERMLKIANVIFNGKIGIVNVAVTSDEEADPNEIVEHIAAIAKKAFHCAGIAEEIVILNTVSRAVQIRNQIAKIPSKENVFLIGDTAGCSSPLAGLGGTLGLTLVPHTIERLLKDLNKKRPLHGRFQLYSRATVNRWIAKSQQVKGYLLHLFEEEGKDAS